MQALQEVTDGDAQVEERFVAMFMDNLARSIDQLERSVAGGEEETWAQIVHRMKGAAANMHAESMRDLCLHAEAMEDRQQRLRAIEAIRAEYERYRALLAS